MYGKLDLSVKTDGTSYVSAWFIDYSNQITGTGSVVGMQFSMEMIYQKLERMEI